MTDLHSLALQILANALGRWVGEVEGQAAGLLLTSVKVAQIQLNVARGLVTTAEQQPGLTVDERRKLLAVAADLATEARADVRRAALGLALAVPREVEAAFDNFLMSAATAAGKVAEQAKQTLVWYFAIAAVGLYLYSRHGRS
jgi:hypothetical protein